LYKHEVAGVTIEDSGIERPSRAENFAKPSSVTCISTMDGLRAEVEVQFLVDGSMHVRLAEFLSTPPPLYSHLIRNGTMTVQVRADGKWVALLRALRPGGKDYPTLNGVTWEELDALLGGNAKEWLEGLGFLTGTWAELNPKAGRFKDSLAVAIPAAEGNLLVLPWALTRVVALMKKLGKPLVVDLG
jgi:hypothetical protein